jgi:Na+/H+-dicarboxylate symporter
MLTHATTDTSWYKRLHWQVLIAMLMGITAGLVFGEAVVPRVDWIRAFFMQLLRMIIVPLVLTSIVSGVASVGGGKELGRLFGKTLGYYILSSFLAILVGLVIVNVIRPGVGADLSGAGGEVPELGTPSSPVELLLDVVPENVVAEAAEGNMLAIIFFSVLFGIAVASLPDRPRRTVTGLFEALFQAMMTLTGFVIRLLPIGVFAMMAVMVGRTGFQSFKSLGLYMVTLATGLTIHFLVTLPLLLLLLGKIRPSVHFRNMRAPILIAFSSSSSGATLPVTIDAVENKAGVSNRVTSFVLPIGATVNMDGTALFECLGVLFIAQTLGFELGVGQQLIVVATALLASIGAAAVPSAGLVIIFIVLEAVNLRGPEVDLMVGAMLAIDRPLDMYRTVVNVFSDTCGAAIIARSEGEDAVDTVVA